MQSCIKFYAGGTGRDVIHAESPEKSKDSKEIDDRIDQVFVYVIAGSNGFERVAVFRIGSVRKAAFHDSRLQILIGFCRVSPNFTR